MKFQKISNNQLNKYISLNEGWKFYRGDDMSFAEIKQSDIEMFKDVNLPHDWSIYSDFNQKSLSRNEGGLLDGGFAYYIKKFELDERIADKDVYIRFAGVYMDSTVWINNKLKGNYPFGYNEFMYRITDDLVCGMNTIVVKVENRQPSSRWYSGSGIYRNVDLIVKNRLNFMENEIVIRSDNLKSEYNERVNSKVSFKIKNEYKNAKTFSIRYKVLNQQGKEVSEDFEISNCKIEALNEKVFEGRFFVDKPDLWDVNRPNLYYLVARLICKDEMDKSIVRFGYRFIEWEASQGISLNGRYLKLHGVCLHHDNGCLGAELYEDADKRKLQIMKDMGVNSIRTSHNPQSKEFIKLCDEMGFLVIEEAFDTWSGNPKKDFDYNRFFSLKATHDDAKFGETWAEFDIKQMVKRDINSPSIFMWSIGNEIWETKQEYGLEQAKNLIKWIKQVDDKRYVTIGEERLSTEFNEGTHVEIAKLLDAVGLNYGEAKIYEIREKHPNWKIYGSETSSAVKSRGVYYQPSKTDNVATGDSNKARRKYQMSDFGNDRVGWGRTAINSWIPDRDSKAYAGQYIWTGFDYIGEPTPWHNEENLGAPVKSSYFGLVDTCGFPKNDYYFYQSQWIDKNEKAVVKILPHWNWSDRKILLENGTDLKRDDNLIPVRVYSNLQNVELKLNGKSLGVKSFNKKITNYGLEFLEGDTKDQLYLEWLVNFEEGKLEAFGRDGGIVGYDYIESASSFKKIGLELDGTQGLSELVYVRFCINDENGNINPIADDELTFAIEGGQILGVDNGNPASQERYKAQKDGTWKRRAFNGLGLVVIRPESNEISLRAWGKDLDPVKLRFEKSMKYSKDIFDEKWICIKDYSTQRNDGDFEIVNQEFSSEKGLAIELPNKVKARDVNDNIFFVDVEWDKLEESFDIGEYLISGKTKNKKFSMKLYVNGFTSCKNFEVKIKKGANPIFPSSTDVYSTSGEKKQMKISKWDKLDESNYEAKIDGLDIKCKAKVIISDNLKESYNYALSWNGSELPAAIASYSNRDENSTDHIKQINNGITSYDSEFKDRWSNLSKEFRENDWVGVIFARAGQIQKHEINKIKIAYFKDVDVDYPESVKLEYYIPSDLKVPKDYGHIESSGHALDEESNWEQIKTYSQVEDGIYTVFNFEDISCLAVRIKMKAKNMKGLGVTELEVYGTIAE